MNSVNIVKKLRLGLELTPEEALLEKSYQKTLRRLRQMSAEKFRAIGAGHNDNAIQRSGREGRSQGAFEKMLGDN